MLIVEEATTAKQVFKGNLVPQSNEPISVENLPAGTYRAVSDRRSRSRDSEIDKVNPSIGGFLMEKK